MMQFVYTVYDRKAQAFGTLMFFSNDDMARRGCADTMRAGGDYPMVHYPDDFDLYLVGSFDTASGELSGSSPVLVARFADYVPAPKAFYGPLGETADWSNVDAPVEAQ